MKYRLFNNSITGMHCVQACLQMLLYYFEKPVLTLQELDAITIHNPKNFTWMSDALVWLNEQGIITECYEHFDYQRFALEGDPYLKEVWNEETFRIQKENSDLEYERKAAQRMIDSNIQNIYMRPNLSLIESKHAHGYFVMASVNPYVLQGNEGYGSHMVVISDIDDSTVTIFDPDKNMPYTVPRMLFEHACIDKDDSHVLFFKLKKDR